MRGPESLAMDRRGWLYSGTADGRIVRVSSAGGVVETFARTGGRPLGLAFGAEGQLYVADGQRGLLVVDPRGSVRTLVGPGARGTPGNGSGTLPPEEPPVRRANGVDVAPDGTVLFTEPSSRHPMSRSRLAVLEGRADGRLFAYHPDRGTRVLLDSLHFPNGVAVSPDGKSVAVAETSRYRVLRLTLGAGSVARAPDGSGESERPEPPSSGRPGEPESAEVLAEGLPGFPDGISVDEEGTYWVALPAPRSALFDATLPRPFLRKVLARLPRRWLPAPSGPPRIVALDADGTPRLLVRGPEGGPPATSVLRAGGSLYVGNLDGEGIAVWPLRERRDAGSSSSAPRPAEGARPAARSGRP